MEIILSKYCDFCNGVKRTIDLCKKMLDKCKVIYSISQVIHNPQVIEELEKKGLKVVENISQIPSDSHLLIRSHGISPITITEAKKRRVKLIDAACPFVKYIQKICKQLKREGYFIIITGDTHHPEVETLKDIAGSNGMVVSNIESEIILPNQVSKLGVITQSTYTRRGFYSIISKLLDFDVAEVRIFNTICKDSLNRRDEVKKLASMTDGMIVIGGRNSANTLRLFQTSKEINNLSFHIENFVEIDNFFNHMTNMNRIGIIGGASTPRWVIDEFLKKIPRPYKILSRERLKSYS